MNSLYSWIVAILYAFTIAGYPLVAAATTLAEVENRPVSIGFRTLLVAMCLALITKRSLARSRAVRGWIWAPLGLFWLLYLVRLLLNTYIDPVPLSQTPLEYWMWVVGACLIPMIALMTRITAKEGYIALRLTFALATLAGTLVLIAALVGVMSGSSAVLESGRLQLSALNPILAGHLGGSICILSILVLFFPAQQGYHFVRKGAHLASLAIGITLLVLSASRGPFVATAGALIVFGYVRVGFKKRTWAVAVVSAVLMLGSLLASYVEGELGFRSVSRVLNVTDPYNFSSIAIRFRLINDAWIQFLESPLVGSGLEETNSGMYPHNVIVESFMTTGVVGGMAFIAVLLMATAASVRIVRLESTCQWIAVLFFQYLIAAQFSGGLWSSTAMWSLTGAVVAVDTTFRKRVTRNVENLHHLDVPLLNMARSKH